MTISDLFTRKASAPVQESAAPNPDAAYMRAWGLTEEAWQAATELERRDMRDRVVYAPYFGK